MPFPKEDFQQLNPYPKRRYLQGRCLLWRALIRFQAHNFHSNRRTASILYCLVCFKKGSIKILNKNVRNAISKRSLLTTQPFSHEKVFTQSMPITEARISFQTDNFNIDRRTAPIRNFRRSQCKYLYLSSRLSKKLGWMRW